MSKARKTGFDRYFESRMADPAFASSYAEARARIDAIDEVVRNLDSAREELGMTKAELARRIGVRPESIRRLFSRPSPNPTLDTVVALAQALDLNVTVQPDRTRIRGRRPRAVAS
jgi:DNA-binding XRE family transcriptional regulator